MLIDDRGLRIDGPREDGWPLVATKEILEPETMSVYVPIAGTTKAFAAVMEGRDGMRLPPFTKH